MPFLYLLGVIYIGVLVYLANRDEIAAQMSIGVLWMLNGLLSVMVLLGLNVLASALLYDPANPDPMLPAVALPAAIVYFSFCIAAAVLAWLMLNRPLWRERLRALLDQVAPLAAYRVDSIMHQVALLLSLFVLVNLSANLLLLGGVEGVAALLAESPPQVIEFLFDAITYTLIAFLGVGLFLRRDGVASLERLGLRAPLAQDWRLGLGVGTGLYVFSFVFTLVWSLLANPEIFQQQTAAADQVFGAFSENLSDGLLLAFSTGFGEEILFRGALQPVFGVLPTSLLFVMAHLQYAFTPATLILFVVTLGFAWLRQNASTTAAIIGHMVYNLIPFVLVALLGPGAAV